MGEKQQFDVWKETVMPAITSKVEEFHLLGYERATAEEVWSCLIHKLRKKKEFMHLHTFVNVILTLKVGEYMNWLTMESYQANDWFANEGVLEEIVKDIT
ncbi:post-transcriptional regulator [Alkalihalobacillus sp. LMS39]|uniref:post-transcriptional regulator n=1 Tax=Alkalihalobacillus sp. LMS39 TaxID=2924032 RepID=UPI001FB289A3|nr:post-transcriptional regulator [Alkalihalobacillus sp. LMS39]UOE95542.1 post-transcriptional regulator [Alkalihalobacillus sp. LMS39]